jgi:hypothetical protein
VVFRVNNDYVKQQARHFELRSNGDGLTMSWDDLETTERLFLHFFIHTGERLRNPRAGQPRSGGWANFD